jgi:dUTP pyrophosphatase
MNGSNEKVFIPDEFDVFGLDLELECILHSKTAELPKYATFGSACFDLKADFEEESLIDAYDETNYKAQLMPFPGDAADGSILEISPGWRVMVPTNVEFVIPVGYKVLVYSRSGLALKQGLNLVNSVGMIDHDYHHPTYVLLHNTSKMPASIQKGDRIAQAELVPARFCSKLSQIEVRPHNESLNERTGGFGSTGDK